MKNFTKLFTLLIMAAMSMGVMASTVDDLVAIDHNYVFIADNVTNNGAAGLTANTLYADGHIFTPTGNDKATNKGSNTFTSGITHLNSLRIKTTQDRLAFKVGGACTVTFYTQSHVSRGLILSTTDSNIDTDAAYAVESYDKSVWEVNISTAGTYYITSNGDLFIAGFEVVFADDPARMFTFGYSGELDEVNHTLSALDKLTPSCAVTTSYLTENYYKDANKELYHGSEQGYTAALAYRNRPASESIPIKSQNGEDDGAENHNVYLSFNLSIPDGYKLSLRSIESDLYVDKTRNNGFEYIIQNGNSDVLYASSAFSIASNAATGHYKSVNLLWENDLQDLQGNVTVKLLFWIGASAANLAVKDFKVTGVLHEIIGQTKTLKAIEVNGEAYDFENEGNSIDALYHAAPSVKFYYDVKNNWSDGSQTDAADENETIVASESAGNYVAATTLASTPYSLTFTNIDLPKVFGITRVVANEKSNSTDMEDDGVTPKTQNKYAVAAISLVDPSDELVTVAIHNGTNQNALFNRSRSYTWNDGTEVKECFVDITVESNRTNANELDENQFFGFDLTIADYHKAQVMSITSDALLESGRKDLKYIVKIYNDDALIATMEEVAADVNTGADMKRTIDLSGNAALKDLEGTITVKMFIYGNTGKYIIVKDLYVEAVVEKKAGEGVEGLVFTDFTPTPEPEFTEGEVTAVFSNSSNNVGPDGSGRGIRMQGLYEYKMRLTVPDDSYISEVVFVWNNNGNPNEAGNCVNLTVKDNSETILGIVTDKKVSNEVTWTCGSVRESELTFAQGDGDFYCHSIRVTYLHKVAGSYHRTHPHMNLNTLCYPYQIDSYEGATFYEILKTEVEAGQLTALTLVEHEGALAAGVPYFYDPSGTELVCYYSGAAAAEGTAAKGAFVGFFDDDHQVPAGSYVTVNNQLYKCGSGVTMGANRAYVSPVAYDGGAPAPGRRILRIGNTATGVESIQTSAISTQKVLRNGQLFIIRDSKTYNVMGYPVD